MTPFMFPSLPANRYQALADAHDHQRRQSAARAAWFLEGGLVGARVRSELSLPPWGIQDGGGLIAQVVSGIVTGGLVDGGATPHGAREVVPIAPEQHRLVELIELAATGGGIAYPGVERLTPDTRNLHFDLTSCGHVETAFWLVAGTFDLRHLPAAPSRTAVLGLSADVVVRGDGISPLQLELDELLWFDDPVEIVGTSTSLALVVLLGDPDEMHERRFLHRRATCHPVMRLDGAINLDDLQMVYGSTEPEPWIDVVEREIQSVIDHADADTFAAWWAARLAGSSDPLLSVGEPMTVRGRFPGGVGVLEATPDAVTLVAGRHVFEVGHDYLEPLTHLVAGDDVEVTPQTPWLSLVRMLAPLGFVSPSLPRRADDD